MLNTFFMGDAAFPPNLNGTSFEAVAGYYGGPNAFNVWQPSEWRTFHGLKLPIWVAGQNGTEEGNAAVAALRALGVPSRLQGMGTMTGLDMETRHDATYVTEFQEVLNSHGYLVWDYGSLSTVFRDPEANGYWVADFTDVGTARQVLGHPGCRAVQFKNNQDYDTSIVKQWVAPFLWT